MTPEPTPPYALPDYLTKSTLLKKRRVKKHQLPGYKEQLLLLHAPNMLPLLMQKVTELIQAGDKDIIKQALAMWGLVEQKGGGFTVNQNMYNTTANVSAEGLQVQGFDALVRSVHEARTGHALPAPEEDPDTAALTRIIDAEVVDA